MKFTYDGRTYFITFAYETARTSVRSKKNASGRREVFVPLTRCVITVNEYSTPNRQAEVIAVGVTRLHPTLDHYDRNKGRKIALGRALDTKELSPHGFANYKDFRTAAWKAYLTATHVFQPA